MGICPKRHNPHRPPIRRAILIHLMSRVPPLFESIRVMNPGFKRPSGPARAGLLTATLVGVLPLLAVLLVALVAGVLVYALATAVARVFTALGLQPSAQAAAAPPEPERDNVRVRR